MKRFYRPLNFSTWVCSFPNLLFFKVCEWDAGSPVLTVGRAFDPEFWIKGWLGGGGGAVIKNQLEELPQAIQSSQRIGQIPGLWEAVRIEHATISTGLQRNWRSHREDSSTLSFTNTKPHRESADTLRVPSHDWRWKFTRSRVSHSPLKCSWELHHSKAPKGLS